MKPNPTLSCFTGIALLALAGCAGHLRAVPLEQVEWRQPSKAPEWTTKEPGFEKGEFLFVGLVDRAIREDLGRTDAREATRVALARDLGSRISSEYGFGRSGDEARAVEEAAIAVADATIRGAHPKEWFTERYGVASRPDLPATERYYRIFVLMAIPEAEYAKARDGALKRVTEASPEAEGKEVLRKMQEKMEKERWPYESPE